MVHLPIEHYSLEDYLQWEGDWELIYGMPVAMVPSPNVEHQRIGTRILRQLDEALEGCPRCEALYEIDLEISQDTVVRPDVVGICYIASGDRLTRVPDIIFEILSRSTARRDEETKFRLYRDEGVGHYVLVYPEARKAKVYQLIDGDYRKVSDFHDELHRFELSKCSVDFDFSLIWRKKSGQDQSTPVAAPSPD